MWQFVVVAAVVVMRSDVAGSCVAVVRRNNLCSTVCAIRVTF